MYLDADDFSPVTPRDVEYEAKCRVFLEDALEGSERTLAGVREKFLVAAQNIQIAF